MIHKALLLLCLLLINGGYINAEEEIAQAKMDAISELMQITGAEANSAQFSRLFTQQMLSILRANNPNISEKVVQIVTEEVARLVKEELQNGSLQAQIYPIYARYFTLEDLQGLIEFNKSPVGVKANKVMPRLMQDSVSAAQSWSENVGPKISERVLNRFKQEGISLHSSE
ncbi:MAG: DUF2059 domain-containing protein [Gammaproteobacteria bacterium]|nr:DUF2059 domain-containing protein [Gammaproteobacteria bacterium]